jgi:hypothetical protein
MRTSHIEIISTMILLFSSEYAFRNSVTATFPKTATRLGLAHTVWRAHKISEEFSADHHWGQISREIVASHRQFWPYSRSLREAPLSRRSIPSLPYHLLPQTPPFPQLHHVEAGVRESPSNASAIRALTCHLQTRQCLRQQAEDDAWSACVRTAHSYLAASTNPAAAAPS